MPRQRKSNAYVQRINRVIDHVQAQPATHHSVDDLAGIACFSPFHFHRIFTAMTGETVNAFVRRVRLERAVAIMKAAPDRTLTRIAIETGFASLSDLSRAFHKRYGLPPGRWDRAGSLENSKNTQADDPLPALQ